MTKIELLRICTVKKWIRSCTDDYQLDSCIRFIERYMADDPYMHHMVRVRRLIINGMYEEAMTAVRECEGELILEAVFNK